MGVQPVHYVGGVAITNGITACLLCWSCHHVKWKYSLFLIKLVVSLYSAGLQPAYYVGGIILHSRLTRLLVSLCPMGIQSACSVGGIAMPNESTARLSILWYHYAQWDITCLLCWWCLYVQYEYSLLIRLEVAIPNGSTACSTIHVK